MHLEIIFPKPIPDHPGIRLTSGYMQRSVEAGKLIFYCPLNSREPLLATDGRLSQANVRNFLKTIYVPGFEFAFYDDETDPFGKPTSLKFNEIESYEFHFNVAYRVL